MNPEGVTNCDICNAPGGIMISCEWITILTEQETCGKHVHPSCAYRLNYLIKPSRSKEGER